MSEPWRGVVIAESLEDDDVLQLCRIVRTKRSSLESESERGTFDFHLVEVSDDVLRRVVDTAERTLKSAWYIHLVRGGGMVVIFRGQSFNITQADDQAIERVKCYGESRGIHRAQLTLEHLFTDPYDE